MKAPKHTRRFETLLQSLEEQGREGVQAGLILLRKANAFNVAKTMFSPVHLSVIYDKKIQKAVYELIPSLLSKNCSRVVPIKFPKDSMK